LSPSKVEMVLIDEKEKSSLVVVPDYQLSLAIGKEGQNVRLAARLCGWKIDIKSHTKFDEMEKAEKEGLEVIEVNTDDLNANVSISEIKKMKKADLIAFANQNGIELDPKAKNQEMIDTILAALEA
ncbi:MAG: transcription termination/antitermination protein NusA, partial [Bacillota bacterium]|nr:transcription termination/antitermination protein NusA [Bacillota bacterium]